MKQSLGLACVVLVAACGAPSSAPVATSPAAGPTSAKKVVGTFTGTLDVAQGTLTLTPSAAGAGPQALVIPTGSGDGTVVVTNASPAAQDSSCAGAAVSFTGQVRIQSNFTGTVLRNVYAVLDRIQGQEGVTSCTGATDPGGLAPMTGILWSYPSIAAGGSQTATWSFALTGATHFTFTGHVVADEVPSASCTPSCPGQCGGDNGCGGTCAVTCASPNACLPDGSCNGFAATGPLAYSAESSGAWLCRGLLPVLSSGQAIVSGGQEYGGAAAPAAELYDPASNTWSTTSALVTPRYQHTQSLLHSGEVLLAGGRPSYPGQFGVLSSAELFDGRTWSATGGLANARWSHTATVLSSGKVLIAGGADTGTGASITATELYDPSTGSWSVTGELANPRTGHTATLLPSGKVLVVGGRNQLQYAIGTAELYDPAAGTWSAAGDLATPRTNHTATLLPSGKVLVAGGSGYEELLGGYFTTDAVELYDPDAGTWSAAAPLLTARSGHTATMLPSGVILIVGGNGSGTAELYDPSTGTASPAGAFPAGAECAALLSSGSVVVVSGTSAAVWGPR